jgi:hypothetical protein
MPLRHLLLLCWLAIAVPLLVRSQDLPAEDTLVNTAVGPQRDEQNGAATKVVADTPVLRSVPDSVLQSLKKKKIFEYANDPGYWARGDDGNDEAGFWFRVFRFLQQQWVRTTVYLIMIGILVFAVYRIVVANRFYLFYTTASREKGTGNAEPNTAMDGDYEGLIREAEGQRQYRLSVRWQYLKTLQLLNKKAIIHYKEDLTNWEYVSQAAGHPCINGFRELTRLYEYTWYGEAQLTGEQYEQVKTLFRDFYTTW